MLSIPLLCFYLFLNLTLILLIVGVIARLACRVVVVQGKSMLPTLADGDRIIMLDWWPKRFLCKGQIVLSKLYHTTSLHEQLQVKRIVATAGEVITTSLEEIQQEDIQRGLARHHDEHGLRTWHIPPQHVFVRGDNRAHSSDSVLIGPLPYNKINGVVLMKLPWTFLLFSRRSE